MIEVAMVRRMTLRALVLAPALVAVLWIARGPQYGLSGLVGIAMVLANLWLAARIIGGVAESNPQLLIPTALATFFLGLLMLTGLAFVLWKADVIVFPVTGFVLVGAHLGLVLWEAAGAYKRIERPHGSSNSLRARS